MGIRIHKVLGYGLPSIKDSRINLLDYEEREEKEKEFVNWIIKNKKEAENILKNVYGSHAFDLIYVHRLMGKEYDAGHLCIAGDCDEDDGPLLLLPIEQTKTWYRYDDIIDYIEAGGSAENKLVELFKNTSSCGIYPYDAGGICRLPNRGMAIKDDEVYASMIVSGRIGAAEYNMLRGKWSENSKPLAVYPETLEHLANDWRPRVPDSIILYCHYMKLFNDPMTVLELEPMIYTYWG